MSRLCKSCKIELDLFGEKSGICPDCRKSMKTVRVRCFRCGEDVVISVARKILVYLDPSKKGGKKVGLYLCSGCMAIFRSSVLSGERDTEARLKAHEEKRKNKIKK